MPFDTAIISVISPTTILTMPTTPINVILFGESGSGKSSVVNMLSTRVVAPVSNGVKGCTFESTSYEVNVLGKRMTLWDTAGLDEGESGRVPDVKAITNLYKLLLKVGGGINLLVFVTRPRIKDASQKNWKLFREIICQGKVPIVTVVTGLEEENEMESWWGDNKEKFRSYNMDPDAHACITASRGKARNGGYVYDEEFEESKARVQSLLRLKCRQEAWKVPRAEWFKTIVETTYQTRWLCFQKEVKTDKTVEGSALRRLVKECGMPEEEAGTLARKLADMH